MIDNYVTESMLLMFSKRNPNVTADIYTQGISRQLLLDLERHNARYDSIAVHICTKNHDRFLIIDNAEVWHIGASITALL